jgi:hypothetical protein
MGTKHGNFVVLDGKFRLDKVKQIKDGIILRPVVFFRVLTDDEKNGGHHHVVAYDRVAEEVVAIANSFTNLMDSGRVIPDTLGGSLMDVFIKGWLRTMKDSTVVVAEFVNFHTYEIVREYAKHLQNTKQRPHLTKPIGME